jgi:hypothetical protein
MLFTTEEIQSLISIVDYNQTFLAIEILGKDVLDDWDKYVLKLNGIDIDQIQQKGMPMYMQSLMWGRLSAQLQEKDAKDINFQDFEKYVKRGQYIPLSKREQAEYEIARQKTYGHLKGLGTKIKNDINSILTEEVQSTRDEFEKVIGEELQRGVLERKSTTSIVSEIGRRTEVWNHDWVRIVETEMNNVFQQGRAQTIRETKGGDSIVFKDVFSGACKVCIKVYLTNGIGSQPILFKLSELEANGDNIGLKQSDWKPTLSGVHPFCRCHLRSLPEGYKWDEEKEKFTPQKEEIERRVERKSKIKITIGDKEKFI